MTPPWTSSLPSHWTVEKLKYIAQVRLSNADKKTVEGEQAVRLCNYVDVYKNDFIVPSMPFMEASATDSQIRELALRAGDILITKDSEDWTDIAVPALVTADLPGVICGYHLAHIRPDPVRAHGGYLFRAFTAQGVADQFKVAANGITRYGVSKDDIASALFPLPPLDEQRAIAAFLDRKTAEVDAVVAKKERMIELLLAERQALISRAVTQGLDASVPMKDSGMRWLGEIPKHWRIERLKWSLFLLEQGWSPQCDVRPANEDEWGVLKVGCGNGDRFDATEQKALPEGVVPEVRYEIKPDDILMSRGNTRELVGSATLVPQDVRPRLILCDLLYRLRVNAARTDAAFVVHQLRSRHVRYQIERDADGTSPSMKKIGQETIGDIIVCLPDLTEQHAICVHIERETSRIDGLIEKNDQQITKLREYRQTLISAAVTGKYAIPLEETPDFRAAVLAAEVVYRLHTEPHFGRTKLHKGIYGAEHDCDLSGIGSDYARLAFGPYDDRLQKAVERELEARQWFAVQKGERGRITYVPLAQAGQHRAYFEKMYGDKAAAITRLIDQLRDLNKNKVERAITLYAAWNDFLIRGEAVDDDRLLDEVEHHWHPEKKHKEESWRKSLAWLKARKLIPHGFGKPTRPTDALTGLRSTAEDEADEDDGDQ